MSRTTSRLSDFFGLVRSAVAVSAAAEAGRQPYRHDLARLGINPDQYGKIGKP